MDPANQHDFFELTTDPIDVGSVARRVVLPECGATVTLDGYAREWTKGRRTVYLVYEAYAPMALRELERLGREAHERFEITHLGIVHRTGQLEIGETSVVIATALAAVVLRESVGPVRLVGAVLVAGGVALISLT